MVEGEHPGSTYYAAELRKPVHEANATAEDLGLPFRFRYALAEKSGCSDRGSIHTVHPVRPKYRSDRQISHSDGVG